MAGFVASNILHDTFRQRHMSELRRLLSGGATIIDVREADEEWQAVLEKSALLIDDKYAKDEWNWQPTFDTYEKIIDDFIEASSHLN